MKQFFLKILDRSNPPDDRAGYFFSEMGPGGVYTPITNWFLLFLFFSHCFYPFFFRLLSMFLILLIKMLHILLEKLVLIRIDQNWRRNFIIYLKSLSTELWIIYVFKNAKKQYINNKVVNYCKVKNYQRVIHWVNERDKETKNFSSYYLSGRMRRTRISVR